MSAYDLLDYMASLKGIVSAADRRATVETLLVQTNLWNVRTKAVAGFSGGMRQRFGIAQALIGNPKLIIVDEPTAGLDPEERNRFHNLLVEIGEHVVVLLSTHIVEDIADLCPRMAVLAAGGAVIRWQDGLALEDALFLGLPDDAVEAPINRAIELHDEGMVGANITSKSSCRVKLAQVQAEKAAGAYSAETRTILSESAKKKAGGWFKSVGYMEDVTFDIVLPCQSRWSADFKVTINAL